MAVNKALIKRGLKIDEGTLAGLPASCLIKYRAPAIIGAVELKSNIEVGAYTYFEKGRIGSLSRIGNYCSIAPGCTIGNGNHPTDYLSTHPLAFNAAGAFNFDAKTRSYKEGFPRESSVLKSAPVIGNDVWIGGNVTILRGVTIGDGAVIGANSVVNRDVAPFTVVAGTPAREIKKRFSESITLNMFPWWDYDIITLGNIPWNDPERASEYICNAAVKGTVASLDETRPFQLYKHSESTPR